MTAGEGLVLGWTLTTLVVLVIVWFAVQRARRAHQDGQS